MIMFTCLVFTRHSNQVCTLVHSASDLHVKSHITQLLGVNLHMLCTDFTERLTFSCKTAGSKRKLNYQ